MATMTPNRVQGNEADYCAWHTGTRCGVHGNASRFDDSNLTPVMFRWSYLIQAGERLTRDEWIARIRATGSAGDYVERAIEKIRHHMSNS